MSLGSHAITGAHVQAGSFIRTHATFSNGSLQSNATAFLFVPATVWDAADKHTAHRRKDVSEYIERFNTQFVTFSSFWEASERTNESIEERVDEKRIRVFECISDWVEYKKTVCSHCKGNKVDYEYADDALLKLFMRNGKFQNNIKAMHPDVDAIMARVRQEVSDLAATAAREIDVIEQGELERVTQLIMERL